MSIKYLVPVSFECDREHCTAKVQGTVACASKRLYGDCCSAEVVHVPDSEPKLPPLWRFDEYGRLYCPDHR